jgi:hypothetical protein
LCPSARGQGEEREEGNASKGRGWPAGVLLLVGFAREKERRKKKKRKNRWFGLFLFEF